MRSVCISWYRSDVRVRQVWFDRRVARRLRNGANRFATVVDAKEKVLCDVRT